MLQSRNNQPPESKDKKSFGTQLDVHSIFRTIQGEGPYTGRSAIFVRLAGCNLQCPGCDTEYTSGRELTHADNLVYKILREYKKHDIIVITGGEPLRQNIDVLVHKLLFELLCETNIDTPIIQIETNGVFGLSDALIREISNGYVKVVCSPKTNKIHATMRFASAFKYVLHHEFVGSDGLPVAALNHPASGGLARPMDSWTGPIYVNPEDSKDDETNRKNMQAVVKSAMQYGYHAGIQLHKLIEMP